MVKPAKRQSIRNAAVGAPVWLAVWFVPLLAGGDMGTIARLLLLAVLVYTPLLLFLAATRDRADPAPLSYRWARAAQPLAAAAAAVSFLLPAGWLAAALAMVWLAWTGLVAWFGLVCLLPRSGLRAEELCMVAGLLYLPVGGGWLVLSRLGVNPLGFGDMIVLLTAVHFHYAGFATPVLCGRVGRELRGRGLSTPRAFRVAAAGVIAGPALVAAGITLSRTLELGAVVILVASLAIISLLQLFAVVPRQVDRRVQGLLGVSAVSLLAAMLLAVVYRWGRYAVSPLVSLPRMIPLHGAVNAVGFVLFGVLGWLIWRPSEPSGWSH